MLEIAAIQNKTERAVLAGLITRDQSEEKLNEYLEELSFLAETAGAMVIRSFTQRMDTPHPATFLGSGKIEEIKAYVNSHQIDLVIFDDDLSPAQQYNIENVIACKIVDRSRLILDIFATRAQSAQAKAQVELAQMQYLLPRLKGMWTHLDRVKGGIGMRGSGEKEIETDRRMVRTKIAQLKILLEKIAKQNETQRKSRGELLRVALVGYTNVGKSTLMNLLSKSDLLMENKLFATLDTTVRKVVWGTTPFLLSDTVGFIRKLPHTLIESFKSTLEETRESDLLLHVVDLSHPQHEEHIEVVNMLLKEIKAEGKRTLLVFNKMDIFEKNHFDEFIPEEEKKIIWDEIKGQYQKRTNGKAIFISAVQRTHIDELRAMILAEINDLYCIRYPYKTEWY